MSFLDGYKYDTLAVSSPRTFVLHVEFNSPANENLMTPQTWSDLAKCFEKASDDENVRAVIISGQGKSFSTGLDLKVAKELLGPQIGDAPRKGLGTFKFLAVAQKGMTNIEKCMKPVIAAVTGACNGGGMDVITACDIRLCSEDATFAADEVDAAITSDLGTVQRLCKVIGSDSLVRELCLTGRKMPSDEARACGLVSKVLKSREDVLASAIDTAVSIAGKSPIAAQGIKHNLNYSRDHSISESLEYIRAWNALMLQSEDIPKSVEAVLGKKTPASVEFSNL